MSSSNAVQVAAKATNIRAQVCRHVDVSEMRIIVLQQHLQPEPGGVLRL